MRPRQVSSSMMSLLTGSSSRTTASALRAARSDARPASGRFLDLWRARAATVDSYRAGVVQPQSPRAVGLGTDSHPRTGENPGRIRGRAQFQPDHRIRVEDIGAVVVHMDSEGTSQVA